MSQWSTVLICIKNVFFTLVVVTRDSGVAKKYVHVIFKRNEYHYFFGCLFPDTGEILVKGRAYLNVFFRMHTVMQFHTFEN